MAEVAKDLARTLVVAVPSTIDIHTAWQDSTTVLRCRGGVPLAITAISGFRIQDIRDSAGTTTVRVVRTTALQVAGTGSFGTRRVAVQGGGSSETLFTYDLHAGRLSSVSGQSSLALSFTAPHQREHIVQQSTLQATLIAESETRR